MILKRSVKKVRAMDKFSKEKREKLANTIIYFADHVSDLSKTKLLKLLYLLEEKYVEKYNLPFLDIEFEVWQAGPVNKDVFIELSGESLLLSGYIKKENNEDYEIIKSTKKFSDDEFSDNDIDMMDFIIKEFGKKTATELVEYTNRPGSAWYIVAKAKGLLPFFKNGTLNSSKEIIEFDQFFCPTDTAKALYREQRAINSISNI